MELTPWLSVLAGASPRLRVTLARVRTTKPLVWASSVPPSASSGHPRHVGQPPLRSPLSVWATCSLPAQVPSVPVVPSFYHTIADCRVPVTSPLCPRYPGTASPVPVPQGKATAALSLLVLPDACFVLLVSPLFLEYRNRRPMLSVSSRVYHHLYATMNNRSRLWGAPMSLADRRRLSIRPPPQSESHRARSASMVPSVRPLSMLASPGTF